MNVKTLAWVLGGALLASAASAGIVACSSNNEEEDPGTGTKDGGTPSGDAGKDGTVPKGDGGTTPGNDSGPTPEDAGGGADCGRTPTLRITPDSGVFCPFRDAGTASCLAGEVCCTYLPGANAPVNYCGPLAAGCQDAGQVAPFECTENLDCEGTGKSNCYFIGQVVTDPNNNLACNRGAGVKGALCANAPGPANSLLACNSATAAEDAGGCPTGTVCTVFKTRSIDMGACLPVTP